MSTAIDRPLELPFTGQALRDAVERRDIHALLDYASALKVAGYRADPQMLVNDLLRNGCTWIVDAFGHRVALQVHVPRPTVQLQPDEAQSFRIAA